MSDSLVPRRAELFLEALGADTDFREAVIGDLAEEFAIRAAWDGPAVARRWYYREAMRVAPHLLRNWWGGLRRADVGHLANVIALSSVCMIVANAFVVLTAVGLVTALGMPGETLTRSGSHPFASVGMVAFMVLGTMSLGVFGGFFASGLSRRAPLPTALSLAASWLVAIVLLNLAIGTPNIDVGPAVPLWVRATNFALFATSVIAGGMLRVPSVTRDPAATRS